MNCDYRDRGEGKDLQQHVLAGGTDLLTFLIGRCCLGSDAWPVVVLTCLFQYPWDASIQCMRGSYRWIIPVDAQCCICKHRAASISIRGVCCSKPASCAVGSFSVDLFSHSC